MKPIPVPKNSQNQNKPRAKGKNRATTQTLLSTTTDHNDIGLMDKEISSLMNTEKNPQTVKESTALLIQTWAMKKFIHKSQAPPAPTNSGIINMEIEDMNPPPGQSNE